MADEAPKPGSKTADLTLGKEAGAATWRRARAMAYCECGGILDLTRDDTPEKRTGPSRWRIGCPCESCGKVIYLTPKNMADIGRTLAMRQAPEMVEAFLRRARRLNDQAHQAMDYGPATSEHSVRLSNAAATIEQMALRLAGLASDKVEVEHSGTVVLDLTPEETAELEERIAKRIREAGGGGPVVDAERVR